MVHNRYRERAGEDSAFDDLCLALRAAGVNVSEYLTDSRDLRRSSLLAWPPAMLWSRTHFRGVQRAIAAADADVVHCHNLFPVLTPSPYYAAARCRVPVVQTLHNFRLTCVNGILFRDGAHCRQCVGRAWPWRGIVHRCHPAGIAAGGVAAAQVGIHRLLGTWQHRVDAFVALSGMQRDVLLRAGLPASRITVAPNPLAADPGPGVVEREYVMFAGRLCHEKGVEVLLSAWERHGADLPPLLIIGDGPLRRRVEALAQSGANVMYRGHCSRTQVWAAMQRALCVVVPSLWSEVAPVVIVEAMATATACVVTDHGAGVDMVGHEQAGLLIPPRDSAALANACRRLWRDANLARRLGENGRRRFEERYQSGPAVARLLAVYRNVKEKRNR